MNLDTLEPKIWLELNAKLQAKKNALRKDLKSKGILKKGGQNDFDHYSYFSEAQYKELKEGRGGMLAWQSDSVISFKEV